MFNNGNCGSEAVIEVQGDLLHIESKIGKATLTVVDKDLFNLVEYEGTAEFKRNDAGKVTSIQLQFGGIDVQGVKDIYAMYWWRHSMLFKKCLKSEDNE